MVPAGLSNVMAIAAGDFHSVALKNDAVTLVEWGDNSSGQTNIPAEPPATMMPDGTNGPPMPSTNTNPTIPFKLIAAGGDHTLAAIFSSWVQYPVDVTKDLLLIYNTNSLDSSNVCQYYLTHRPMVAKCTNVLGIGCTIYETILPSDYTTNFAAAVQTWLTNNPTKRPQYVVLFQDLPSRVNTATNMYVDQAGPLLPSVQYQLHNGCSPGWYPFVTAINMNGLIGTNVNTSDGTNDCIAYINKLTNMVGTNQTLFISATAASYGNINWYFDDADASHPFSVGLFGAEGVESNGAPSSAVTYTPLTNVIHITNGTNVAGYCTWGANGGLAGGYATNGTISFAGASTWYLIATVESYNGQRGTGQGNFLLWYSINAFEGTNYSNTPVGAITHVDEPDYWADNCYNYFGLWASGKSFAICAWAGQIGTYVSLGGFPPGTTDNWFQAVGDPFVTK
jgi:hypothetical protein